MRGKRRKGLGRMFPMTSRKPSEDISQWVCVPPCIVRQCAARVRREGIIAWKIKPSMDEAVRDYNVRAFDTLVDMAGDGH